MSPIGAGTRLGSYEVIRLLGKGGMGEVYAASDTKLGRHVAIKVLPEAFTHDPDRVNRFKREAKVLAALNHPNIAVIHGLDESGAQQFLVMELVEGETLADKLDRGALPTDEALQIALQIAEALQAAHEKGIVHRDLKPANVKITPDGKVKVLDFGLAKVFETDASGLDLSNSPTLSGIATNAGLIFGTAAYMSPEQAKGFAADPRSDVFAFGCILYEMLSGKAAFAGDTVSEILASVLKTEPDLGLLPSHLNPRLRKLLERMLAKNPKRRFHAIADVRFDLEEMLSAPQAVPAPPRTSRLAWIAAAAALLALAAISLPRFAGKPANDAPEMRLEISMPPTPAPLEFALSPDGRYIVFVASGNGPQRLWLRSIDKTEAQPMTGTDGADYPFWSADSRSIGFFSGSKLYRVDIAGGPPRALANAVAGRGGTWNQSGTIVLAPQPNGPLVKISASGGDPVAVTRLDPPRQTSHRFPHFLPDGRHFIFFAQGPMSGIYLGSVDAEEPKRLATSDTAGTYLPSGHLLFVWQGALLIQRFDVARGELTGDPAILSEHVTYDGAISIGAFSASADGRIAFHPGGLKHQLSWFDRTGKPTPIAGADVNDVMNLELSPDERRIAVERVVLNNVDIWLIDLIRGSFTRFTFDGAQERTPLWSPEGTRIVFSSNRKGVFSLYSKSTSGVDAEELLLESPNNKQPQSWTKDGRSLLYFELDQKRARDLWSLDMSGAKEGTKTVVANTPFEERNGQFYPDGRFIAYETNESGRFEIVVQPFPTGNGKWQVSASGGTQPRWSADGKELYFISPDRKLMAARVTVSGAAFESGTPAVLFQTRIAPVGGTLKHQYAVSRDGRFLINEALEDFNSSPIIMVLNWKPKP